MKALSLLAALAAVQFAAAQGTALRVSDDGHSLVQRDGKPFFYLADTAWELFGRLNREEVVRYLDDRKANGFTVIQTAFLALHQGPNGLDDTPVLYDSLRPLTTPGSRPTDAAEYDWWDHADFIFQEIAARGFYVAIAPFRQQLVPKREADAARFGRFLGERYRNYPNVIWTIGFDPSVEQVNAQQGVYRTLARGIAEGVSAGREDYGPVLMTFHPSGPNASSRWFHGDAFLDFNLVQTGHGRGTETWRWIARDYERHPAKPVLDAEATYEAHPLSNVRGANGERVLSDDADVRAYAYWNVFAGAAGHTYGHHSVWQMHLPARGGGYGAVAAWQEALAAPGARQMRHLRTLVESRPFLERQPDQSLVRDTLAGGEHLQALRGRAYAFVYSPQGRSVTAVLGKISGRRVRAGWFNPRDGASLVVGTFRNRGTRRFTPPTAGRGNDWVLVLDDAASGVPLPGRVATGNP